MVCLSRPYHFKFFKGCLPQISLGPFLNTLSQISLSRLVSLVTRLSELLMECFSCYLSCWKILIVNSEEINVLLCTYLQICYGNWFVLTFIVHFDNFLLLCGWLVGKYLWNTGILINLSKLIKKKHLLTTVVKGDLRPKLYLCFYGIFLLILWRKSLVQRFVGSWSNFTKLHITKFWIRHKWRHSRKCTKGYHPWFSLHIFVSFMDDFVGFIYFLLVWCFDHFSRSYKVIKFWMIERKWRHTRERAYKTC